MVESEYNSPQIRILKLLSALFFVFVCALPAVLNAAPPETSLEGVPPDLPLPASAPCDAPWMAEANMLQPVGHSQFTMMTQLGNRPRHLQTEFGFNAITIQPPDSHNCDTGLAASDRISEAQFCAAMAAYRAAGYRVLLYTSVEACGQTPEFQSGQIAREHPEWSQRDPKGNPVLVYGQPWLCPTGGCGNTRWTGRCASPASTNRTASCWTIASSFLRRTAGRAIAPHARKHFATT